MKNTIETVVHPCNCGSGLHREAQYDAQDIFLCYTCPDCHDEQMSKYRPEILTGYDQSDVDEPIEPEDGGFFADDGGYYDS